MNKVKKIAIVGCALIATSALLVSFTNDNGGDKNKKYQIIHHAKGEMITYDTVIPMSSSFTPEQFLAEKGISDEHVEIITIPSISAMDIDGKAMRTIIREIEMEGDDSGEEVEISVEIDENGKVISKKTVNGVEVEMTEEELTEIKSHHGDHGKVIQMHFDSEEMGDNEERIEISVEMDDEGNKTIKKVVNGEEVEMTEDELSEMHVFNLTNGGDDVNILINGDFPEGLEDEMKELQIEIEKMVGDIDENNEEIKIITKRIEMNTDNDGNDFKWSSDDGEQRIMVMSSDKKEDFTVVLVTENYEESASQQTKMIRENSSKEMGVFPNPNDGKFKIRYESEENKRTTIKVNDATGKEVFQEKLGKFSGKYEKELNLKEFGSGMYTITIQNGDDKEVHKVMIK